jgi:hypothetical protein
MINSAASIEKTSVVSTIDNILSRLLTALKAGIHAMGPMSPTVAPLYNHNIRNSNLLSFL